MQTLWTFQIGNTRFFVQKTKNGEWVSINNMDTGYVWEVEGMHFDKYAKELSKIAAQFTQLNEFKNKESLSENTIELVKYEDEEIHFENNEQKKLYENLKVWRTDKARELKLPPYIIFHNLALFQISKYKPSTKTDLMKINGIGKVKLEKYGDALLEIIKSDSNTLASKAKRPIEETIIKKPPEDGQSNWHKRIEKIKSKFPNYSFSWDTNQDEKLKKLVLEGLNINQISASLQRTIGGIRSRLNKIGLLNDHIEFKGEEEDLRKFSVGEIVETQRGKGKIVEIIKCSGMVGFGDSTRWLELKIKYDALKAQKNHHDHFETLISNKVKKIS